MATPSYGFRQGGVQPIALRDYQKRAVNGIRAAFRRVQAPLFVGPTGCGKTVLFAYITSSAAAKRRTVYILVHRRFLVDQVSKELTKFGVGHGVIMGNRRPSTHRVQVASVQSLGSRLDRLSEPDLLVVDECHHAAARSWEKVFQAWPRAKRLGVTATPERLDGHGLDHIFHEIVYGPSVRKLIDSGYLAEYDLYAPPQQVDLSAIKKQAGDYHKGQLADAMDKAVVTGDAVEHYAAHLNGRPAIAFCVTRKHAEDVAAKFRSQGFRSWSVDGSMRQDVIDARVAGLADGRVQVLTSCDLISEGFDVPATAGAILLRPTKSRQLFFQQVGRALRPKEDGGRAVILDHVGNSLHHGLPDTPVEWSLAGKKKGEAPPAVRQCRLCYEVYHSSEIAEVAQRCGESACPLAQPDEGGGGGGRDAPGQQAGELERLHRRPAWANGIDIITARGPEYQDLLAMADTKEKLQHIQKLRGYKPGWLYYQMRDRGWIKGKAKQEAA